MQGARTFPYFFNRGFRRYLTAASLCLLGMLPWSGCSSSPETMKTKLDEIAKEDLQGIVAELPAKAKAEMLAKPYYAVDEYQEFHGDTAIVFQAYASLVFFYLDPTLDLCQIRKYRYKRSSRIWDRYDVKLKHIPEKYTGSVPP
jgi:hypothetical protein